MSLSYAAFATPVLLRAAGTHGKATGHSGVELRVARRRSGSRALPSGSRRDDPAVRVDLLRVLPARIGERSLPKQRAALPVTYHLLVETREANLSRGMRHLNGVHTQAFYRRHMRVEHVLQPGRLPGHPRRTGESHTLGAVLSGDGLPRSELASSPRAGGCCQRWRDGNLHVLGN
jgi:hypothetical protein